MNGETRTTSDSSLVNLDTRGSHCAQGRVFNTAVVLSCMVLIGLTNALIGSTFVDMMVYLETDTQTISLVLPLQTAGVVVASLLSIANLNRISEQLSIGLSCIILSILVMNTAAVRSIVWYHVLNVLVGFFTAVAFCDFSPYLLKLWDNHRLKEPILHSYHALWALGLSIGPIIITPFLDPQLFIAHHNQSMIPLQNSSKSMIPLQNFSQSEISLQNLIRDDENNTTESSHTDPSRITVKYNGHVQYAYIALGFPLILPALCITVVFFMGNNKILRESAQEKEEKVELQNKQETQLKQDVTVNQETEIKTIENKMQDEKRDEQEMKDLSQAQRMITLILLALFIYMVIVVQLVPHTFFTLFVTRLLSWQIPNNTLINTVFFGSVCAGRFLGIIVSAWIKQSTVLILDLALTMAASIIFLFSAGHDIVVWLGAALLGLGLSSIQAAIVLWLSEHITITGQIIAIILIGTAIGGMTGPLAVGQLFTLDPMWMTYIVVAAAGLAVIIYAAMRLLLRGKREKTVAR